MTSIDDTIDEIAGDLAMLEEGDERYGYLIDLGRELPLLEPSERNDATKVRGCVSQVWLISDVRDGRLYFRADSDAHIVRGLIAILLKLFSERGPNEILAVDPKAAFAKLGLTEALTPQRSNGLFAMMTRIRRDADAALNAA